MSEHAETKSYRGLPGAFPYAFRHSHSRLFKCYVVVGGLLTLVIGLAFVLSVIRVVGETGGQTATLALSRTFVAVLGLLVVIPVLAPVLLVARRHRRGVGTDARYDRRLAATGFVFVLSLYLGLIATVPPEFRTDVDGVFAPLVEVLYALPTAAGVAIPVVATVVMYVIHRVSR